MMTEAERKQELDDINAEFISLKGDLIALLESNLSIEYIDFQTITNSINDLKRRKRMLEASKPL